MHKRQKQGRHAYHASRQRKRGASRQPLVGEIRDLFHKSKQREAEVIRPKTGDTIQIGGDTFQPETHHNVVEVADVKRPTRRVVAIANSSNKQHVISTIQRD